MSGKDRIFPLREISEKDRVFPSNFKTEGNLGKRPSFPREISGKDRVFPIEGNVGIYIYIYFPFPSRKSMGKEVVRKLTHDDYFPLH